MISLIITSFREPTLEKAVDCAILNKFDGEIIIVSPDEVNFLDKDKRLKYFKDPGKGKAFALNLVFEKAKGDILVLTDGDVFLDSNAVNNIVKCFKDSSVGCVCGRPVPVNSKKNMLGFWAHLLADAGAHEIRKKLSGKFLECSGYLFAFRNIIRDIPVDVAEDSIIPYLFYKKGYSVVYSSDSLVYYKSPESVTDFIKQRKRTADAHTKLTNYYPDFPKVKTLFNEVKEGTFKALNYCKSFKEFYWVCYLLFVRLYVWFSLFYDLKFKRKEYVDGWERVGSAR